MNDFYSVSMNGKFLQGIEPNSLYVPMSMAPTMGRRHDVSEFSTIWGDTPVWFERLTVANNIRTLLEEFRWGDLEPQAFSVNPKGESEEMKD